MEITNEEYIQIRNDESLAIKDMSIEQIKARITDYEMQRIRLRARQQSCIAIIQEDEKKRSLASEMKSIVSKETIVSGNEVREQREKEAKKNQSKLDKQIESWLKMGIDKDKVRVMARMIEPEYLFDDEKKVKKHFLTCLTHGKYEISKEEYETQQKDASGWHCNKEVTEAEGDVPHNCNRDCTYESASEIIRNE